MRISKMKLMCGEKLPRGYRIACWDMVSYSAVIYPFGLHWIARAVRRLWEWSWACTPSKFEELLQEAWTAGRKEGTIVEFLKHPEVDKDVWTAIKGFEDLIEKRIQLSERLVVDARKQIE